MIARGARGLTLVELLVTVSIIGILVVAMGFSFQGWISGYKTESQIRQVHADMMSARQRALTNGRFHFVTFTVPAATPFQLQYSLFDDRDPWPDGNGTLDKAADVQVPGYPKAAALGSTKDSWLWSPTIAGSDLTFDQKGFSPDGGVLSVVSASGGSDYDCLVFAGTKINIGKMNGGICVTK